MDSRYGSLHKVVDGFGPKGEPLLEIFCLSRGFVVGHARRSHIIGEPNLLISNKRFELLLTLFREVCPQIVVSATV